MVAGIIQYALYILRNPKRVVIIGFYCIKWCYMTNLFPRGVARGEAFYDRHDERRKLKQNIANIIHTVLIAPRRYGKTSLMNQVLYENKLEHLWFDFMTITSKEDVQEKLLHKIGELISRIIPTTNKLKKLSYKYFRKLRPEITFSIPGVSLTLKLYEKNNREGIVEALTSLDNLAQELNTRLVVVFDEFQEILRIDKDSTLQGAIRHAVERSKHITYLFSGSKHRPLRHIFSEKENPLYTLCEILEIGKIAKNEYIAYINKVATEKWGKPMTSEVIDLILTRSDYYPKYINILCASVWLVDEEPTVESVTKLWNSYILSKKTDIAESLSELTLNQRRLLQWLCFHSTTELYKRETLRNLKMSQSSVQRAIIELLNKDHVIEKDGVYRVLDPIWASYFKIF